MIEENWLWTAVGGDDRGKKAMDRQVEEMDSGKKAMESRERRLQRVEKRLWTAGIGDHRGKKGYGPQSGDNREC